MKFYLSLLFFMPVTAFSHNLLPIADSTALYREACAAVKNKDLEGAIPLFRQVLKEAEDSNQPRVALQVSLDLGATFAKSGQMEEMENLLEASIAKCKPEWVQEFGALIWLKTTGKPYLVARPPLLKAWAKMENQPSSLVKAYLAHAIGRTFLDEQGLDDAIKWYTTAQGEYEKQPRTDVRILSKIYNELAGSYEGKENIRMASFYYTQALRVASPHESELKTTADILTNITSVFEAEGNNQAVLTSCRMAMAIEKSLEKPNPSKIAAHYLILGNTYKRMGDFLKAEDMYHQAKTIYEQLEDNTPQTQLYIHLAALHLRLNELDNAKMMANKGLEMATTPETRVQRADLLLLLANIEQQNNQVNSARQYYQQAIALSTELNTPVRTADAYLNLVPIYLAEKDTAQAADLLGKSLAILKNQNLPKYPLWVSYYQHRAEFVWHTEASLPNTEKQFLNAINACLSADKEITEKYQTIDFQGVIYSEAFIKTLNSIGTFYQQINAKPQALLAFEMAINYQTFLRKQLLIEESKMRLSSLITPIAQKAFPLAFDLYKNTKNDFWLNKAFQFAEADKAGTLNDLNEFKNTRIGNDLSSTQNKLVQQLQVKRKELVQLQEDAAVNIDSIYKLRTQIVDIEAEISTNLSRTDTEVKNVSVAEMQKNLQKEELMLHYYNNDSSVWLLVISPTHLAFHALNIHPDTLQQKVEQIHIALKNNTTTTYLPLLSELHQVLIAPIEADNEAKTLIITPHSSLSSLPFDLLLANPQNPTDYLLYKYAICYAYSAKSYINTNIEKEYAPNLAAFAPIHYPNDSLPSLNNAESEVRDIAALCKTDIFLYKNASEQNFKKIAKNYGILLLATHGYQHPTHYEYSQFLLQKDKKEDGFLNTYEIANQTLNAEMTVLSACNSGAGTYKNGEGVLSLARGFAAAGCPNIILTQWQVADKQHSRLTHLLFQQIMDKKPKHIALQQAKIQYLKEADRLSAAPFFWAGTVLMGNTQPIHTISAI